MSETPARAAARGGNAGRLRLLLAALAGPILFAVVAWPAIEENAATYDETAYVPAGYTYLARGDYRLSPEHPPLLKALGAAPLLPLRPALSPEAERAYEAARTNIDAQWIFGDRFLYRDQRPQPLLRRARLVTLALGASLVLAVFLAARQAFGLGAGLLASGLLALDPNFLAHGTLATTDAGAALFLFLALDLARRSLERASVAAVLGTALFAGAALASKFTALLLAPAALLLCLLRVLRRSPWTIGRRLEVRGWGGRATACAGLLAIWATVAFGCLWAAYRFRYAAAADGVPRFPIAEMARGIRGMRLAAQAHEAGRRIPDAASFERLVDATPRPLSERLVLGCESRRLLPEAYLFGLAFATMKSQARSAYLLGEHSATGWGAYFPIAFAVKTPMATLLLLVAALALGIRRSSALRTSGRAGPFLIPAAVFGTAAIASSLNIGHRHILPLYPFLYAAAGSLVPEAKRILGKVRGAAALAVALALVAGETLHARPHFLPFFNTIAGGARGGIRILADSNLDWGQALPALKRWMDGTGVEEVNLCYFGTADPAAWGIRFRPLPGSYHVVDPIAGEAGYRPQEPTLPGYVAISATHLQGVYLDPRLQSVYAFLRAMEPVAVPGGAIYVYRVAR